MTEADQSTKLPLPDLAQSMANRYLASIEDFRGDYTLTVKPEQIVEVCLALRDEQDFELLIDETAVDFWPAETPRFHVIYQLRSVSRNLVLSLCVHLDGNAPALPTITGVYPNANWFERELWDLFGIRVDGHPDLRRILMPQDWIGHPLRKDYPLGYEEPQFSFNFEQIQAKKLSSSEKQSTVGVKDGRKPPEGSGGEPSAAQVDKKRPKSIDYPNTENGNEPFQAIPGGITDLVSERALQGETLLLNMGPQHPSTHGVLRLLLELDGENVLNVIPDIGFLHTGVEKNMEAKTYVKAEVMTDRLDYMNNTGNNLAYVMAIEKLVELDVPPRAQGVRVILVELQRIASHLVWLGTHALDLAAMSVFLYCFREREIIMDIMEMVSGQRMMTTYFRPGGLWRDVPAGFEEAVRAFIRVLPERLDQYESLLTNNPLFIERTRGLGVLSKESALAWGITGPMLRSSGINYDLRKARPYSGYEQYDFEVPLHSDGDTYARYVVRIEEMRQSLRIVEQALSKLPGGPVISNNRKYVPPPRAELGVSMEAVIHHFKYWTEGFRPPEGAVYSAVESPRGELGVYLVSDGGPKPYRVHWRTPSFNNLQILPTLSQGHLVADLVTLIGTTDIVLGDVDR